MKPKIGDTVKIFIKSSVVEGRVYKWGKKIVLSSDDNKSFMVINKPKNIFMYKVLQSYLPIETSKQIPEDKSEELVAEPLAEGIDSWHSGESSEVFLDQDIDLPMEMDLRAKSLAELHKLKIEEERKLVAQKLKQHHTTGLKKVNYELPGFFKKQGSE
jgi:hypothetical protein